METKAFLEKTNIAQIKDLEEQFQIKFPPDFISFLLENNGGFIKPNKFKTKFGNQESACEVLFGIDDNITKYKHLTLNQNFKSLVKYEMPKEVYPIGNDPFGNQICLCLSGENYGNVYFYDHEIENQDSNFKLNWDNLFLISTDFSKFLLGLF